MVFAILAIVVGCIGSAYVGMKSGFRTGFVKGAEKGAELATDPENLARVVVHAEGCTDCGPQWRRVLEIARLRGVPTDHPDRKTGQYL